MSVEGILKRINENPISPEEMTAYLRAMEEDNGEPCFERGVFMGCWGETANLSRETYRGTNISRKRLNI